MLGQGDEGDKNSDGLIEVQGTAEGAAFSRTELNQLLDLAGKGVRELMAAQRAVLAA
jgi:ribonuclease PH